MARSPRGMPNSSLGRRRSSGPAGGAGAPLLGASAPPARGRRPRRGVSIVGGGGPSTGPASGGGTGSASQGSSGMVAPGSYGSAGGYLGAGGLAAAGGPTPAGTEVGRLTMSPTQVLKGQ